MRKTFFTSFALFLTSLCFAVSNMKLYGNAEFLCQISDDALYGDDGELIFTIRGNELYYEDEYAGTITEGNGILSMDVYFGEEMAMHTEFSKATGFLLINEWHEGKDGGVSEYDEITGLKKKMSYYTDGQLDSYEQYEYEKGKVTTISYYNADDASDGCTRFVYDKKTGAKIKELKFNAETHLVQAIEYDSVTEKRTKKSEYNNDESLKMQTMYDKNSGDAVERLVYSASSRKPVKWTFLKFDDGIYTVNDDVYLNSELCLYYSLKKYSEESKIAPIEWNEQYSAVVRKHDFNKHTAGYEVIEMLKNEHFLSSTSFALCHNNSNFYYCFATSDNDEIDLSSCYEIELIKKPKNYPAMNKSGKGSGPFGFDIGMTYDEVKTACGGSEPEHIADNRYYVKPKKTHPLFEKYIVWISDAVGLYYIRGISRNISTSEYGTEAKRQFSSLRAVLEKKYGTFSLTDTIKSDYYWKDEKDWMRALREGARTYYAEWTVIKENYMDFDGLFGIQLGIECANKYLTSEAYIWIEYVFQNYVAARDALDDVL